MNDNNSTFFLDPGIFSPRILIEITRKTMKWCWGFCALSKLVSFKSQRLELIEYSTVKPNYRMSPLSFVKVEPKIHTFNLHLQCTLYRNWIFVKNVTCMETGLIVVRASFRWDLRNTPPTWYLSRVIRCDTWSKLTEYNGWRERASHSPYRGEARILFYGRRRLYDPSPVRPGAPAGDKRARPRYFRLFRRI